MRASIPSLSSFASLLAAASLLCACPVKSECLGGTVDDDDECVCPPGTIETPPGGGSDICTAVDGGVVDAGDAGSRDAGDAAVVDEGVDEGTPDAGPCGMACTGTTLVCDEARGICAECTATNTTACSGATPVCDTTSGSATEGDCVACNADSNCSTLASAQCDIATHTCVPCTGNAACTGRAGTVCGAGTCVQCTGADRTACGANVCDVTAQTCASFAVNSANLCEACVSDAQCQTGQVCVAMSGDTPTRVLGHYCLWLEAATGTGAPAGDCLAVRPYRQGADRIALEAGAVRVCEPRVTTCEALLDFDSSTITCTPAAPAVPNDACGATDVDDGYCQFVSGVTNRCTVACTSFEDCPDPDGAGGVCYRCTTNRCSFTTGTESGGTCI